MKRELNIKWTERLLFFFVIVSTPLSHADDLSVSSAVRASQSITVFPITHVLVLSSVLFFIGLIGVSFNRRNVIAILMSLELMFLAVNFNFIAFSRVHESIDGQVFVFYSLAVAAVESAIGLAIFVLLYRQNRSIDVDSLSTLKG